MPSAGIGTGCGAPYWRCAVAKCLPIPFSVIFDRILENLSNAFVLIVPRGFRGVNGIVEHLHLAVALNGDVLRRASQE